MCIEEGDLDKFKAIIEAGYDINQPFHQGGSLFSYCAARTRHFFTDFLQNFPIDIDATDESGRTALMYSVRPFDCTMEVLITEMNANINLQDELGETVLMKIAYKGNKSTEMCKKATFLINHGADLFLKNNAGETALDIANKQEFLNLSAILEKGMLEADRTEDEDTPTQPAL